MNRIGGSNIAVARRRSTKRMKCGTDSSQSEKLKLELDFSRLSQPLLCGLWSRHFEFEALVDRVAFRVAHGPGPVTHQLQHVAMVFEHPWMMRHAHESDAERAQSFIHARLIFGIEGARGFV